MVRNLVALAVAVWCCGPALSQVNSERTPRTYPVRPVKLVVPFGSGTPDTIARIVAQQLGVETGQPFIVENKVGANGIVGTEAVARATPDGYTLLVVSASFAVNPSIYRLPYDSLQDFVPVSNLCALDAFILAVHPSIQASSVQELIALARKADSKLAYGSPGIGNTIHLAGALFNARAGTNLLHIPYKGGAPAVNALLAGEVQVMFSNAALALSHIKAGKLRALGVTGRTRLSYLPEVPTLAEAGVPGMDIDAGWFGLFAPANVASEVIAQLGKDVSAALGNTNVRERLLAIGMAPVGNASDEFKRYVEAEIKAYAERVRLAGIRPE